MTRTVTLSVATRQDANRRLRAAFEGKAQGAHIVFDSADLIWKVLTARRWEILRTMTGAGPFGLREVARRVGRDVKGVHGDVHALLDAGVIDRQENGGFVFPYDRVRVEFTFDRDAA
jgi:predicted transcriptional regulator